MTINRLLWIIYLALLAVLLPHTAWAFGQFETPTVWGTVTAWAAAFAFEAAIAALTHKLAQHIEHQPKRLSAWARFVYRYINAYSVGLMMAVAVSVLTNLAHAVEFGRVLAIFAAYGIPPWWYAVALGAILPGASLLFARVLSEEVTEDEANPEMEQARAELREANRKLRESEAQRRRAEEERNAAEVRFAAVGDFLARLTAAEKRERIAFARQQWPALPKSSIAIVTGTSPSYVGEVWDAIPVDPDALRQPEPIEREDGKAK